MLLLLVVCLSSVCLFLGFVLGLALCCLFVSRAVSALRLGPLKYFRSVFGLLMTAEKLAIQRERKRDVVAVWWHKKHHNPNHLHCFCHTPPHCCCCPPPTNYTGPPPQQKDPWLPDHRHCCCQRPLPCTAMLGHNPLAWRDMPSPPLRWPAVLVFLGVKNVKWVFTSSGQIKEWFQNHFISLYLLFLIAAKLRAQFGDFLSVRGYFLEVFWHENRCH